MLHIKKGLSIGLFTLIAVTLMMASCEKEGILSPMEQSKSESISDTRIDLTQNIVPDFSKQIEIKTDKYTCIFDVGSNSSELLAAFDEKSLSMSFINPEEEMALLERGERENSAFQADTPNLNVNDSDFLEGDRKYIRVELVAINTSKTLLEIPPYKLTFSDEVLKAIKNANAATIIDFEDVKTNAPSKAFTLWNNNKIVVLIGDNPPYGNGTRWTKARNYYARYGQSYPRYYLNKSWFPSYDFTSTCCKSGSKWVRRVVVVYDVVKSVQGWSNYCGGSGSCYSFCYGPYSGSCSW